MQLGVGSISNIRSMLDGEATMAMTQSDIQRDAVEGVGTFAETGPARNMRSISALFVEQITIATRRDKGIISLEDLKGRRAYLGTPGTGNRVLMERLMSAEGWQPGDVIDVPESSLEAPSLAEALCDAEVDAIVTTAGHPNPQIREATSMCDVVLVPLAGPKIDEIIASEKFYAPSNIPAGLYKGVGKEVPGIGLVATLVTTADAPADVIYAVTQAIHEGFGRLQKSSPLFASLSADQLAEDGLTAPLHEGAARYYAEIGQQPGADR